MYIKVHNRKKQLYSFEILKGAGISGEIEKTVYYAGKSEYQAFASFRINHPKVIWQNQKAV